MNVLKAIFVDFVQFFNVKTNKGRIALFVLFAALLAVFLFLNKSEDTQEQDNTQVRAVRVAQVSSFTEGAALSLIGTVSATSRAVILSEVPGRVTAVPVKLGDTVGLGQKIAQLENSSAYASLLQAEGAYEAALASSQVSDVSVVQAQNAQKSAQDGAVNTYRTTYTSVSNIILNTLDVFYSDPEFSTPGVKIKTGQTNFLNAERVAFSEILTQWQQKSVSLGISDDLSTALEEEKQNIVRVIHMTDVFISAVNTSDNTDTLNGLPLASYASSLHAARTSLNASLASVEAALLALQNAEDSLAKAVLAGSGGSVSIANAQVKQALGSLKAAQANYNKTILRSPIAGKINSLDVQAGDHVTSFQKVAEIANNNVLEVTAYVGQTDREILSVQQQVRIDGVADGVISTIAPAVNPSTGKIEVKIQTTSTELVNGSTVSIMVMGQAVEPSVTQFMQVPLTAVKFTASAGVVYSIQQGVLVEHSVEIGPVRNSFIEITSGITSDIEIVSDARGLSAGEEVRRIEE